MDLYPKKNTTLGREKGQEYTEVVFTQAEKDAFVDSQLLLATKNPVISSLSEYKLAKREFPDSLLLRGHVDESFVLDAVALHKKFAKNLGHVEETAPNPNYL